MPEGDTLHRLANTLAPRLVGQRIARLQLRRAEFPLGAFAGATVESVEARGKHLLISCSHGQTLHAHLGMTGVVHCYAPDEKRRRAERHIAFVLRLENGVEVVGYRVPRLRVVRTAGLDADPVLALLGPDLLAQETSIADAVHALRTVPEMPLGEAVLDQRIASGIGNVYKSEVLFRLRLDPFAPVASFSDAQLLRVYEEAQALLRFNVDAANEPPPSKPSAVAAYRYRRTTRFGGNSPRRIVSVYGRKDEPCFDCGARIDMRRQGAQQRSTYFCPRCQNVALPSRDRAPSSP